MSHALISFLVPNLSEPTVMLAVRMARMIQSRYRVEIVGPDLGGGVCSMYRGAFPYKALPCPRLYRFPDFFRDVCRLERAIAGDIVFSIKAYADTLPVALRARRRRGCKVVAYLDEWDGALFAPLPRRDKWRHIARHWHHPMNELYHPWVERMIRQADAVVSSSTFLQNKFGGQVIPLGVDCEVFKPRLPSAARAFKKELGFEYNRLVVYGGVARPHKGIEDVARAILLLNDPSVLLVVVGPETDYLKGLMSKSEYAGRIRCIGAPPSAPSNLNWEVHNRMADYLAIADALAVPLADTPLARSQTPCKVFEAMAMAKPVVATALSDLPAVMEGCGWLASPGGVPAWGEALAEIFANSVEAEARSRRAREKCLRLYSVEAAGRQLMELFDRLAPPTR